MQVELSMILDDRGMGYFSDDLYNCEADDEEEDDEEEDVNVDNPERGEQAGAGVRLRQHKRPELLRTRL